MNKKCIRFFLDEELHQKFKTYIENNCCDYSKVLRKLIYNLVTNDPKQQTI